MRLEKLLEQAKQDPNGILATQLRRDIESGKMDEIAIQEGVDLTRFGRQPELKKKDEVITEAVEEDKPGFLKRVAEGVSEIGQRLTKDLKTGGERFAEQTQEGEVGKATGTLLRSGLRSVGAVTEAAFEPVVEAPGVKQALEFIGEKVADSKVGQQLANLVQKHPEQAQDVMDIVNTLTLGGGRVAEAPVREGIAKAIKEGGETLVESGVKKATKTQDAFVRDLVRPVQTKRVKESQVARTTEKGSGPFKRSEIAPSTQELQLEEAVKTVDGVSETQTHQQNFNVIQKATQDEALALEKQLADNDFIFPKKELNARLDDIKTELADNPSLVGSNERVAEKLINGFNKLFDKTPAKGSALLKLRKDYDKWVSKQKGSNIFDPKTENAFSVVNREIRQGINNFLEEKAINVSVKDSLRKQSSLYRAMDNIKPKAAIEADTAIGRAFQNAAEAVGIKNKIVQQIGAAVGLAGFGAAATFAPAAAVTGGLGFLGYKAGKLLLKPELRTAIGKLLKESGSVIAPEDSVILKKAMESVDELTNPVRALRLLDEGLPKQE